MRVIKLFISLSVAGADLLASAARRLAGRSPRSRCVVLYYHAIPAASRGRFAAQMDLLIRLSVPIDIEDGKPSTGPHRCSAVTFDDAFVSVVEHALPELRARGIPCTIFVPTGALGFHPGWIGSSHPDAGEVVTSPDLLKVVASDPLVGIGSHSVSHPNFCRLDDACAKDELCHSKTALEELLGRSVRSFSFPHGAYTPRSLELARECGYTRVFTIEPERLNGTPTEFTVGRVRVEPTDWPIEFRMKVMGAYRWMVHASAFKRRLLSIVRGSQASLDQAGQGI